MKISTLNSNLVYNFPENVERKKQPKNDPRFTICRVSQYITYIGVIISSIIIIVNYFSFQVSTKVDISIYRETKLPSIGICFFYNIEQKYGPILLKTVDNHTITRLTVKQINDLLPNWDQLITSCKVFVPEFSRYVSCTDLHPNASEYLNLYSKCFRLFSSPLNKIKYNMYKNWANELVTIKINKSALTTSRIGLFLNNPIAGLQGVLGDPSFIQLETAENNLVSVTFKRIQILSKPYPYETNCFDYTRLECRERKMCIHRCVGEAQLATRKEWNYLRYIKLTPDHLNARFSDYPEPSMFSTFCFQRFPEQPCLQSIYIPELATEVTSPFSANEIYTVSIIYPYGTEKLIEYYPKTSFTNFIINLTSVIGIWITLPLIKVFNVVFDWTHRAVKWKPNVKKKFKSTHLPLYNDWLTEDHKRHTIRIRHHLSHVNKLSARNLPSIAWY